MNSQDRCFIITPIGDDSDPIRRHIEGIIDAAIRPALCDKYELVVAHKISEPGSITKQIIKEIYSDKLTIFYKGIMPSETGFRFSSGL